MTPAELRRIAEAATKGPWVVRKNNRPGPGPDFVEAPNDPYLVVPICSVSSPGPNAKFIATFNPERVLELLDENERLTKDREYETAQKVKLAERLAAVEKLHQPEVLHGKTYCSRSMYQEYAGGPYYGTPWPCDTIKAARGE